MFIYRSHMGGLYTTEEEQDWDDLYCETCGDSDRLIGEADSLQETWDLVGPSGPEVCDTCELKGNEDFCTGDYITCDINECVDGMSIEYILEFLAEQFPKEVHTEVYLIGRNRSSGKFFAQHPGYKNAKNQLPHLPCAVHGYEKVLAKKMMWNIPKPVLSSLRELCRMKKNGKKIVVFTVEDISKDVAEDIFYSGDGWYGWSKQEDLEEAAEKIIEKHL